jgi:endonuclease/exonuclease/phosphatase family metal-dependent hydrolase
LAGCADDLFNDVGNNDNGEDHNPVPGFGSNSIFSLVTWNVEYFPKQNVQTINLMAEIIVDLNVDIFGLQEITSTFYFNQLIDKINDLDSINQWIGFRAEDGDYQELAYVINTSSVTIINTPYSILNEYDHYFAYREPYVIKVSHMNDEFIIINNHFKCCGDGIIQTDYWDEEYRRQQASIYLKNYIDTYLSDENVIVLGDFNDDIAESQQNNVFQMILDDSENYLFVDLEIANGNNSEWSYPSWPSHLDHIIITNELFDEFNNANYVQTLHLEESLTGEWNEYDQYISDHRPVGFRLVINP